MRLFYPEHAAFVRVIPEFRRAVEVQLRYLGLVFIICCMLPQASMALNSSVLGSNIFSPVLPGNNESASSKADADSQPPVVSGETAIEAGDSTENAGGEVIRLHAGDTLYLDLEPVDAEDSTPKFDETKIYTLNYRGELLLPFIGSVPLAGLSESEAVIRLSAEPLLQGFKIEMRVLPLEPLGSDALELFGQSLFKGPPTSYADTANLPVPGNYILGPGDTVVIQLYGKENVTHELIVSRDGVINFPDIGPVPVSGQTFGSLASNLKERVAEQLIGVKVYVTMGELRSINVVLAGEVVRSGNYTISAMSTVTNVLFSSGGVTPRGSLRNIQVRRNGNTVTKIDLYDLLLRGSDRSNAKLQSGDVIYVPLLGETVGISGEVQRPAIYELKNEKTISDILTLAGGPTSTAYVQQSQIARIGKDGNRMVMDLDIAHNSGKQFGVQHGDIITIPRVLDQIENGIELIGHVKRPGEYQWREGMRLTDLISSQHALKPKPDLEYVVIRREKGIDRRITVFSASLHSIYTENTVDANVLLQPNDRVYVFGFEANGDRQLKIQSLIDELEQQADGLTPAMWVNVGGPVREAGTYPLESGMSVSRLIQAAGNLKEEAYPIWAELTRYSGASVEKQRVEHIQINLAEILKGDAAADMQLQPRDHLIIKRIPNWVDQATVEIEGEVRFPGTYPIARGESLASVLTRAGGLNEHAAPHAAIFTRESLKKKEGAHMEQLAERLETELKSTLLEKIDEVLRPQEALAIANELLEQLRTAKPIGRLVIDLPALVVDLKENHDSKFDVILEDSDKIIIPAFKQEVSVVGEVFQSTSHVYYPDRNIGEYIEASGGYTRKADRSNTYVIRANGSVNNSSSWGVPVRKASMGKPGTRHHFGRSGWGRDKVGPGDTIVVPINVEKVPTLAFWRDVTSILFQLAVTAEAIDDIQDD